MNTTENKLGDNFIGHIEGFINNFVFGWVAVKTSFENKILVKLYIDDVFIAEKCADLFRQDLADSGVGDGCHAFAIEIPIKYRDDLEHNLEIIWAHPECGDGQLGVRLFKLGAPDRADVNDEIQRNMSIIFDEGFYINQSGLLFEDAKNHYCRSGWKAGLDPHPLFSTNYYLKNLKRELKSSDPLSDFLTFGIKEYASTHPLFDIAFYLRKRADILSSGIHPLIHYLKYGKDEEADISWAFNSKFYADQLRKNNLQSDNPAVHYLTQGWKLNLKPNVFFVPLQFIKMAEISNCEPLSYLMEKMEDSHVKKFDCAVRDQKPTVSIIILNYNRAILISQCIYFLQKHTDISAHEIIIIDNGSDDDDFKQIVGFSNFAKIIRSDTNLGFGEANNIGVQAAAADIVLFLNNDAFVTSNWLQPLLKAIELPGVGAAGPLFLFPNDTVQEAGAFVFADGTIHQRSKGLNEVLPDHMLNRDVSYISAAALLMRKDLFERVGGFDLIWDPAYYEDVDLCLKLQLLRLKVRFVPESKVYHLEGSTSSDPKLRLRNVVSANRLKFVNRWNDYLSNDESKNVDYLVANQRAADIVCKIQPTLGIFTPYPLTHGGGERFLLSFAHELRQSHNCNIYTPQMVSHLRLQNLAKEFGFNLEHLKHIKWSDRCRIDRPDIFISLGNEALPYVKPIGKSLNLYVCQFPFPMAYEHYARDWDNMRGYDDIIVYSEFVKKALLAQFVSSKSLEPAIKILPPAVMSHEYTAKDQFANQKILNVGRFHPGGHCKRQDVMIEAFKILAAGRSERMELHLAGSLPAEGVSREYFESLQLLAKGFNIFFYPNCSLVKLQELYKSCGIYWHVTGIKDNVRIHPERFEHFGITIVEAMSAGLVPIVLGYGGPGEIVRNDVDGFHIFDTGELINATLNIIETRDNRIDAMRLSAKERAASYDHHNFNQTLNKILHLGDPQ